MAGTFYGSDTTINGSQSEPNTFDAIGNGSNDVFNGGESTDTFNLGSAPPGVGQYTNSTVNGGYGDDSVSGIGSQDVIYGNQNDDSIFLNGTGTQTTIYGGQGNDFVGGLTTPVNGSDYLIYGNRDNDFTDLLGTGSGGASGAGGNNTVYGGQGNDTIIGSLGSDSLFGGQNDDVVVAVGFGSTVYGDAPGASSTNSGDDILASLGGTSTLHGGYGDDIIAVGGTGNIVYGNQGNDAIIDAGSLLSDSTSPTGGFSTIYGGQGSDIIVTSAALGGPGGTASFTPNDVIYGNQGNDIVFTSNGTTAIGDAATVYGGQGNDQIVGNNAESVFTGGQGSNTYFVAGATEFQPTNNFLPPDALTITDFVSGKDRIDFGGDSATSTNFSTATTTGGLNSATELAEQSTTEYTFVAGTNDGYLFYNPTASRNGTTGSGGAAGGTGNNGTPTPNLQVVQLSGANNVNDVKASDIFGGAAPTPTAAGANQDFAAAHSAANLGAHA